MIPDRKPADSGTPTPEAQTVQQPAAPEPDKKTETAAGGAKDSGRGTAASSVMKQESKTPFETGSRR